ncbi:DUF1642 domain-containing protein [Lacticaseibacillus paracasei]|uniref:DUF1642 domain-containing protein n=1 Tax=Lacticaseibacillus paracasei TaxID=1597 RepID=UPI000FF756C4|nr:DUF1642 domain-containing protein [Lacticaseibacillus paracasei]RND62548.1 hypothetical protein FAM18123_01058 [Lacticaseibacillus paracasei]
MSEEKLYAVKDDEGKYLLMDITPCWDDNSGTATKSRALALEWAKNYSGHVVTFVEEPEKVVLTEEQAEIVDTARVSDIPATYISARTDEYNGEESLLMNALVNGYTVKKEKKYLLPMDGTLEENDDNDNFQLYAYCYKGRWLTDECETDPSYLHFTVTQKELETAPAWVKAINPVEVTDDEQ